MSFLKKPKQWVKVFMARQVGQGLSHLSTLRTSALDGDSWVGRGTELLDSGLPAGQVNGLMESHAF